MIDSPSGRQQVDVVNEIGLYTIISLIRPRPKAFQRWLVAKILPAFLQKGIFTVSPGKGP
jgi:prophage antirepressor-like protein